MSKETIRYTREDITVVWKPDVCIHSAVCVKGLHAVFNPAKRPWINMDGAELDAIVAQVAKCPSGAISIEEKNHDHGTQ
jgi:uncharacterized Fe-S cluster protein YjdI